MGAKRKSSMACGTVSLQLARRLAEARIGAGCSIAQIATHPSSTSFLSSRSKQDGSGRCASSYNTGSSSVCIEVSASSAGRER